MTTFPDRMGSDGISGGMTQANYGELANEHVVGVMLVEAISNAIRRAQKACPTLDTGLFEDALSDFRGGLSTLNDELTSYEGNQF